ncbi:ADP-ribose pyrophosphatase, mitochondrial isoform X1 [Kryptolebias marmoratus]|nr:ADP-ribose pyrophosphatase, mitochondrial isoform X1 [Kryptolebias marmoratus]
MVCLASGRNWAGTIRLTLTLLGLPYIPRASELLKYEREHLLRRLACKLHPVKLSGISCTYPHPDRTCQNLTPFSASCCRVFTTRASTMPSSKVPHVKSRCPQYPGSSIKRFPVPDDKVGWGQKWPQYDPVSYTAPEVLKKPAWADPDVGSSFSPKFNAVDGAVDRTSFEGSYRVENGKPLNPLGRTGLTGRGLLGRWGPNHAADPIVTRWKVDKSGAKIIHSVSKLPILQFVAIRRKDCGEWAIPGGMVDPGEQVSVTLQREFSEEALNSLAVPPAEKAEIHKRVTKLFQSQGFQVYKGYVDDPRNTDNAWMETIAANFHNEAGDSVSRLPLHAGDDAGQVQWVDIESSFTLYASHSHFLQLVAKERKAHW